MTVTSFKAAREISTSSEILVNYTLGLGTKIFIEVLKIANTLNNYIDFLGDNNPGEL